MWVYLTKINITDDKTHYYINVTIATTMSILVRMMMITHGAMMWPGLMDYIPFFKGWNYEIIIQFIKVRAYKQIRQNHKIEPKQKKKGKVNMTERIRKRTDTISYQNIYRF